MIELLKKLLGKKEEKVYTPDPPGRTFKKIPMSKYFEGDYDKDDLENIAKAKQSKVNQIKELELMPMFLRYKYKSQTEEIAAAHVVFQKEVFDEKWNMVHVTEISFSVLYNDFEEFEKMAGVSLEDDFRNLTAINNDTYNGVERRKEKREVD